MTNNHFETINPVEVPLTQGTAQKETTKPQFWYQSKPTVIALGLCLVLVIAVIFLLPKFISPVATQSVDVAIVEAAAPAESPFQQQQDSKARREAQNILDQLLEKQQHLESKQVTLWAQNAFQQAVETAQTGDKQYRQRQYTDAMSHYRQADIQLQKLITSIPERFESSLQQGLAAIDSADIESARENFKLASTLAPQNTQAIQGLQRSENLQQVLDLISFGYHAQQNNQLEEALFFYQQAFDLDPLFKAASIAREKVKLQIDQQSFSAAMSQGYDALEDDNFANAKQFFSKAIAINPNDEAANNGLRQANNQLALYWFGSTLDQAASFEHQEQWQKAAETYQTILNRDSSIIDAKVGKLKADARNKLDAQIEKILSDPQRLATDAVFIAAQQTLRDAEGIANPGVRLKSQISRLQHALATATEYLPVKLISDNQTKVSVYKVSDFGTFMQKTLSLKPGRYIAVGTRKGYRSVRLEFVVNKGNTPSIEVICREPIS